MSHIILIYTRFSVIHQNFNIYLAVLIRFAKQEKRLQTARSKGYLSKVGQLYTKSVCNKQSMLFRMRETTNCTSLPFG